MRRLLGIGKKLLLSLVVLLALAVVLEVGARVWLHAFAADADFRRFATIPELQARYGQYERFQAHRHLGFSLVPGYERGKNRHNALGMRGAEIGPKRAGITRIVCCGGSTTYGEGVDDWHESMPVLLEQQLRAAGRDVEVLNAGCPGWTTLETLINFETRLLDLEPDCIVVYHGINDALARMVWPPEANRGDLSGWLNRERHLTEAAWLEQSALARILLVRSGAVEPHGSLLRIIGDAPATSRMFAFRAQRISGSYPTGVFGEVPIEQMLETNGTRLFERNLRSLLAVAGARQVRVVLCTFAYSKEFPARDYIGHPAVQASIDRGNDVVRTLGLATGTQVVDLAPELVDKALFTDGVHFTFVGNQRRAALLAVALQ